jgi:GNAT superfamily N-acetyltransferase
MINALTLPAELAYRSGPGVLRRATVADLVPIMGLLSDDPVSASRGDTADDADLDAYGRALEQILADPANDLLVVDDGVGSVQATMQLTRIPGMARQGATRLMIEAVRVRSDRRSSGIGSAMMRWVVDIAAQDAGAAMVQLTSDEARVDAHRFYERLGFIGSHRGFKYRVG